MAIHLRAQSDSPRSDLRRLAHPVSPLLTLAALLWITPEPVSASEQQMRHALVGLAAYAECKVLNAGYSRGRAQAIIESGIKSKGLEQQAAWLQSPQAIRAVALTTEAMNDSCNDFDRSSPQFIPAMQAIDAL